MTAEFNPAQLNQMAMQAFADLLSSAQQGALNGDIPVSVVRSLFSLQQSFFTSSQDQSQQRSLNEGNHSRAQPLQVQTNRNAPKVNGTVLIQKPVETLEAKLDQLLANQPKAEARQSSVSTEKPIHTQSLKTTPTGAEKQVLANTEKQPQITPAQGAFAKEQGQTNTSTQKGVLQTSNASQKNVLQELEKQFDVVRTPELKAYLPVLLSVGQALTQTQDLLQMLSMHSMQKFVSTEIQKGFAQLKQLTTELKELMSSVAKNPSILPKLEAHMQVLGRLLQNISRQMTQVLSQSSPQVNPQAGLTQGGGVVNSGQTALQQHPPLRELLTSLIVKSRTAMPTGEAATIQQVATAKLPTAVIAPFTPQHRTENRNFKSTLKKPGPEPVWEDHHEEESESHENCDEKEDEENETPT